MSMNDVDRELRRFLSDLKKFNSSLNGALKELETEHSAVTGLWKDSFRKQYDRLYTGWREPLKKYIEDAGPKFEGFLTTKIAVLQRYLNG